MLRMHLATTFYFLEALLLWAKVSMGRHIEMREWHTLFGREVFDLGEAARHSTSQQDIFDSFCNHLPSISMASIEKQRHVPLPRMAPSSSIRSSMMVLGITGDLI